MQHTLQYFPRYRTQKQTHTVKSSLFKNLFNVFKEFSKDLTFATYSSWIIRKKRQIITVHGHNFENDMKTEIYSEDSENEQCSKRPNTQLFLDTDTFQQVVHHQW